MRSRKLIRSAPNKAVTLTRSRWQLKVVGVDLKPVVDRGHVTLNVRQSGRTRVADATGEQLRAELRAALAVNISRLHDALRAELERKVTLEPSHPMQFEVDPMFYGITSCASEEPILTDYWLDGSLPADWYDRAEEALGGWDALVSEELCSWFAVCWRESGGPQRYSPAFLFFHDYHNDQYDLERRCWLSGTTLDKVWDGPDA